MGACIVCTVANTWLKTYRDPDSQAPVTQPPDQSVINANRRRAISGNELQQEYIR